MTVHDDLLAMLKAQYQSSPIVLAMLEHIAARMQDTIDVSTWLLAQRDIDTAEGEQLDILGGLIGAHRPPAQETRIWTLWGPGEHMDPENLYGLGDPTDPLVGGYIQTPRGLADQGNPDAQYPDIDYRVIIKRKAASFRVKMTREVLFNYLIGYGSRCKINDDETLKVTIDPYDQNSLTQFERWHVLNRGFKPAGISVEFEDTRDWEPL
jgi:hypothetical protein